MCRKTGQEERVSWVLDLVREGREAIQRHGARMSRLEEKAGSGARKGLFIIVWNMITGMPV